MDPIVEGGAPQTPATETAPEVTVVTVPKDEWEATKHKADVSSQNFERLKKLEEELETLKSQPLDINSPTPDPRIGQLETTVNELKSTLQERDLKERHPVLKDVWPDFEKFRQDPENKGMNLNTAAKAFLTEKGLLEGKRPGLEKPTGGTPASIKTGMTSEEAEKLRKTDYRKYTSMLEKGLIVITD